MSILLYAKMAVKLAKIAIHKRVNSFQAFPYKYTFVVTYRCDSKCNTCGIWEIYRNDPEKVKQELTTEEICKTIDNSAQDILWLNFTGGEPTLRKDLADIVKHAYDVCPDLGMINIPMNGLNPTRSYNFYDSVLSHCKNIAIYSTVSLDMLGDDYVKTRGVDGFSRVEKTFDRLLELKRKHKNFFPSFQLTVSDINGLESLKTFQYIRDHGLPIVTFAHKASLFHNENSSTLEQNESVVAQTLDEIRKIYPTRGLESLMPKIYLTLAQEFLKKGKSPIPCSAFFSTTTVDPYGNVMACPFYYDKSAGNIRDNDYNLRQVFRTDEAQKLKQWISRCRSCWINCEAIPSIMEHFPRAFYKYIKGTRK